MKLIMNLIADAKYSNVIALMINIEEALFFTIPSDAQVFRYYAEIVKNLMALHDGSAELISKKYNLVARIL